MPEIQTLRWPRAARPSILLGDGGATRDFLPADGATAEEIRPMIRNALFASVIVLGAAAGAAQAAAAQAAQAAADADGGNEKTQVIFTDPLDIKGGRNLRVTGRALNVENNWLYVAGDLIDEETGLVQQFDLPMEYYRGVEDGESWTEGDPEQASYLPALPGGRYTMRLEAQWENWNQQTPPQITVRVEQGVPRLLNLLLVLVVLSLVPLFMLFRHFSFERRRWADSAFNPYDSGGGDSDSGGGDE